MSKLPEKPGLEKNSFILHYRILDKIGEGGGGIVYKAQDTHLDRTVVVKLLKDTLANQPRGKERFLREARLASALDHPNIATIYNIHEYGDSYFIVMQFVLGTPLNQILQKKRPELTTSLSIAIQISDALVHAHQKGIIHRDIKPSNIMITAEGQCKILDFGLAKQSVPVDAAPKPAEAAKDAGAAAADEGQVKEPENEDVKITHQGTLIGTPLYLSPEMARGESVNEQTDIFSLGIILYQMLTQRLPFGGSNRVEVLHAVTTYSPPPASTFNSKVPPRLDEIIRKALAKKREDRYAQMKDFLLDLEEVARDQFHETGVSPDELPHEFKLSLFKGKAKIPEGNLATKLLGKIFNWSDPDEIQKLGPEESIAALQERRIRSAAVLPFLAVGDDDGTFGLALGDRLSVELSKLGDLAVSPFHSASVLTKEERDPIAIGHELRVQSFLTGTWVKTGSTIRITPQLVRTDRGEIIWSDLFDFKGESLVEIVDRAAETIGARLKSVFQNQRLRKVREKETENHEAFEAALRGKHMQIKTSFISFNKADLDLGVRFYREALRLDPEYAKAWGDLGVCYLNYIQRGMGNQTHLD
ncbi:MAG: protein kinase, partial [Spirochaetia bacterium]|nr:protein kinase [Spirochaetia bacterium]